MPICPRCGAEVGPDNVYCSQCGNTLLKICYHCGSKIPLNANFCNNCGTRYEKFEPKFDYKIPVPVEEGNTLTDMRDEQRYNTVKIGNQVWLAENFRFKMPNSYIYGANENLLDIYGRLYTWESACKCAPPGWHLATRRDFNELGLYCKSLNLKGRVGTMLKSSSDVWKTQGVFGPGVPGTDDVGFAAKPFGSRTSAGVFNYMGSFAYFWCADEENESRAYYRHLSYFTGAFQELSSKKDCAFSVRLVKKP